MDYKGQKVITQIIENKLVDKIVYQFLDTLNKKKNLENNFFNYLVKYYSTEKVIGDLSIENFLVLYLGSQVFFDKPKVFYLESNDLNFLLNKNFSNELNNFVF